MDVGLAPTNELQFGKKEIIDVAQTKLKRRYYPEKLTFRISMPRQFKNF